MDNLKTVPQPRPSFQYRGCRTLNGTAVVLVGGRRLGLYLKLFNHSPTGFEWGFGGSGPAQLALAILAHHFGPGGRDLAVKLHQAFKRAVVAGLPKMEWTLTSGDVAAAVQQLSAGGTPS